MLGPYGEFGMGYSPGFAPKVHRDNIDHPRLMALKQSYERGDIDIYQFEAGLDQFFAWQERLKALPQPTYPVWPVDDVML